MAKKKDGIPKAFYVRVETLHDLARYAMASGQSHIKAIKAESGFRLFLEGERAGSKLVYYSDIPRISKYLIYRSDDNIGEVVEMTDSAQEGHNFSALRLPIVQLAADPFVKADAASTSEISVCEVVDYGSIVRALVNSMSDDGDPRIIYSFMLGKQRVIGSFDIFRGHGKAFAYARIAAKEGFSAFGYDYTTDTVDMVSGPRRPSKIYIGMVNLAEPLPFFKKEGKRIP